MFYPTLADFDFSFRLLPKIKGGDRSFLSRFSKRTNKQWKAREGAILSDNRVAPYIDSLNLFNSDQSQITFSECFHRYLIPTNSLGLKFNFLTLILEVFNRYPNTFLERIELNPKNWKEYKKLLQPNSFFETTQFKANSLDFEKEKIIKKFQVDSAFQRLEFLDILLNKKYHSLKLNFPLKIYFGDKFSTSNIERKTSIDFSTQAMIDLTKRRRLNYGLKYVPKAFKRSWINVNFQDSNLFFQPKSSCYLIFEDDKDFVKNSFTFQNIKKEIPKQNLTTSIAQNTNDISLLKNNKASLVEKLKLQEIFDKFPNSFKRQYLKNYNKGLKQKLNEERVQEFWNLEKVEDKINNVKKNFSKKIIF